MTVKLCKDCRYYRYSYTFSNGSDYKCHEPDNVSIITGELMPYQCYEMRRDTGRCGWDAKLFVSKYV